MGRRIGRFFADSILDDPHLIAIAVVAIEWERVEAAVEKAIWLLLGTLESEDQARSVTTHIGWNMRCDILKTLVHEKLKTDWIDEKLAEVLGDLSKIKGRRNRVVHCGNWSTLARDVPQAQTFTARGELKVIAEDMDVEDIYKIAHDANEKINWMDNLLKDHGAYERSWPDKS